MITAATLIDNGVEDAETVGVYSQLKDVGICAVLIACCETTAVSAYLAAELKPPSIKRRLRPALCAVSFASVRILAVNQLLRARRFTCPAPFWYGITDGVYH